MRNILCSALLILFGSTLLFGQNDLLINAYNRTSTSLNGHWKYIIDPYENGYYNYRYEPFDQQENPVQGAFFMNSKKQSVADLIEYDFDKMDSIQVPGDWNSQKKELLYYEGTVWYKKSFDYNLPDTTKRQFLYFGASNYKTEVYFNGKKLGTHVGGFTPFNFEITDLIQSNDNFVIVKVDNKRTKNGVPTLNTDWWNYGGLTRDVKIVETSKNYIQDYSIQLSTVDANQINGSIQLSGQNIGSRSIEVDIPELKTTKKVTTDENGKASFEITSKKLVHWSVETPHLYEVIIRMEEETLKDQIGFRQIATEGSKILLNGDPIFLKGISIHEESPTRPGRAFTESDAEEILTRAKELGCNYVRLAHYPHNEHMVRLADKMGILVWEENPVYWTISWEEEETYANAENQLSEVISRDKNRACVIIWSMANETPTSEARNTFLTKLASFAKAKDPTRLISAALEQSDFEGNNKIRTIHDPFAEVVDILSFNQYIGWYDGPPEKCAEISWNITQNKPVLISEFGAGAKYGLHGTKEERWTEEYQEYVYQQTLQMIDGIEQLQGFSPWILTDFRSPRRVLPEIQDGWNRKGLLSERGEKKLAYFVLQEYYNAKTIPK